MFSKRKIVRLLDARLSCTWYHFSKNVQSLFVLIVAALALVFFAGCLILSRLSSIGFLPQKKTFVIPINSSVKY